MQLEIFCSILDWAALKQIEPSFAALTIPHAENIPTYYQVALRLFKQFVRMQPEFMTVQRITTKLIYNTFVDARKVDPRIIHVHPLIQFSITWRWIHCPFVDAVYRDRSWRSAHHILPTQNKLYQFKCSRLYKCNLCNSSVEIIYAFVFSVPYGGGLVDLCDAHFLATHRFRHFNYA